MRSVLVLLAAALPATAQTPLSAEAFDELTRGRTFYFTEDGMPYGAEEYRENREVLWTFLDGQCIEGTWYQSGDAICFVYEEIGTPQCWHFFDQDGLRAQFLGGGTDLRTLRQTSEPLTCLGPDVGV